MYGDDPMKQAAWDIAAAAREVTTGVAVAARAKRQARRASEEPRCLDARSLATGAWHGVQRRDRPQIRPHETEGAPAERRRREA